MFLSFSKTLKRMGGFRIGVGLRLTRKNAVYMAFLLFFVGMLQLSWYVLVGCGWLVYWIFYGIYKLFTLPFKERKQNAPAMTNEINYNTGGTDVKKPIYKRWYVWVAALVVVSFIVAPFLPESETPPEPSPDIESVSVVSEAPTEKPSSTVEPAATPNPATSEEPVSTDAGAATSEEISETTPDPSTSVSPSPSEIPEPSSAPDPAESPAASTPAPSESSEVVTVWLSASGSKYHSINNCGTMNPSTARQISLDSARNNYSPCENCDPPK